jgi:BTB/POZ domain
MLKNNHFADIVLSVADGQEHVHSIVLEVRCAKLAKACQAHRKGGRRKKQVFVDLSKDYQMNSATLKKVLRFIYADDLELEKFKPLEVLLVSRELKRESSRETASPFFFFFVRTFAVASVCEYQFPVSQHSVTSR